jgi:hypothetical protein
MLRLRDIMTTGVITVTPDTTLREAMELFAEHHISGMPVMEGTRVVGVVSASDVLAFAAAPPAERDWPGDRDLAPADEDPEWEGPAPEAPTSRPGARSPSCGWRRVATRWRMSTPDARRTGIRWDRRPWPTS